MKTNTEIDLTNSIFCAIKNCNNLVFPPDFDIIPHELNLNKRKYLIYCLKHIKVLSKLEKKHIHAYDNKQTKIEKWQNVTI